MQIRENWNKILLNSDPDNNEDIDSDINDKDM